MPTRRRHARASRRPPEKATRPRRAAANARQRASSPREEHLVVVGASAGGIEALSRLVSKLKSGFPAPVVIAQHLDPTRASHLGAILERRTELPVVLVQDREPLENGHIYVVPSNRHVVIQDGHVALEMDHEGRPRPSVDLLLSSAARSYGDRLIAIILTGSGSDGAAGAVDVKDAGGVVVIQNPQTAAYPSMPLALPPTAVDHVADLDAIGPLVLDLITGATLSEAVPAGARDALPEILALITRHSAIDFRPYKPTTILRRIGRRMAVTHNRTVDAYLEYLQSHPAEVAELVMGLLIQVTEFFRDPEAFTHLRQEVLPALIARGRDQGRVLRVWSAGCATGEEAYSIALMIADALGAELPDWSVKVFATDVEESAIHFARRGFYPSNVVRNLPDDVVGRYFEPFDSGFRVGKTLRQLVIFGQQDVTRGVPFPRMDLVVCRNLLIYFQPELQEEVLDVFAYALHQTNGFLLLGKAETARPSRATFEQVHKKWKLYRCIHGPLPGKVRGALAPVVAAPGPGQRGGPEARPEAGAEPVAELGLTQLRRLNEVALRGVPVGLVVIDRHYRILSVNSAARRLLAVREASHDQDFLHAVRGLPYDEVRAAIDRAFRERESGSVEVALSNSAVGEPRYLALHVAPPGAEGLALECVVVTIVDVTEQVQVKRKLDAVQAEQVQLTGELGASNHRFVEMNKELQDANEELQASNEELMLAQEELQATNEEFEATNEELQATNEELETNNEELQATNEELETTNEELQARGSELQELNRILIGERSRLTEMVELAPLFIIVLRGPDLVVEASNPASLELLGGRAAVGRPFEDVCHDPALVPLVQGVREVYRRDRPWTSGRIVAALPPRDGAPPRELVYTVVPSHALAGHVEGVMVYAEDVSEKREAEDRQRADMLRLMIENAHPAGLALYDTRTGRLLQASPQYLEVLRRIAPSPQIDLEMRTFRDLNLLASAKDAEEALERVRTTGRPIRIPELRHRLPGDGKETIWDWALIPISVGEGPDRQTRQAVVCAFEVTDQVQWRDEMTKLDRVKDEFLAMASHELRTPLVPLTAYVDLMERLIEEARNVEPATWGKEGARLVSRVRKQIADLTRLTDDLLDVGRLQSGAFSMKEDEVDLAAVVQEAREQASQLPQAPAIRVSAHQDGLTVRGDEGRLVQALYNLIANAVRHAIDGGAVDVRLARIGTAAARIEVQDYGPGIAVENQPGLFTRFNRGPSRGRGSRGGLGLGLYICRQIVERHGGSVTLQSEPGKGANFSVELPLAASPRAAKAAAGPPPARRPARRGPSAKRR